MITSYVRSGLMSHFPKIIQDLGYDPDMIFAEAGIDLDSLTGVESLVPPVITDRLLQVAEKKTQCEHIGLLMGVSISLEGLGPIILMMQAAPTFREAIEENIKYLKVSFQGIERELHVYHDAAYISNRLKHGEFENSKAAIQMIVATLWRVCNLTTNNRWHAREICFTFDEPKDTSVYARLFKTPVKFSANFNGIVFNAIDLELKLASRNYEVHKILHDYVSTLEQELPTDFVDSIKNIIRKQLDTGKCSIESVVEYLPFEKRALQRKLKRLGITYQELLDDVRFDKATMSLRDSNIGVSRLADILGYSNVSVFSKAFKKRFGMSPNSWRKQVKKG